MVFTRCGVCVAPPVEPWAQVREAFRDFTVYLGFAQGCRLRGSRGSHRTPSHPVEDPLDPTQIGKVP
jgi:hypothetical protein